MTEYHYIVHATNIDNVGIFEADTEQQALTKLNDIYRPEIAGKVHENVSVEIITADQYTAEKDRIELERKAEAEG